MSTGKTLWTATKEQRRFITSFGDKAINGEAALFVGAGASRSAGFVDWKELLTHVATELDLDIGKEHDLLALAQYHVNRHGSRGELNQQLIDAFIKDAERTEVHDVIARLPIDTVWTTNYDQLLEKAYEESGRTVEVKLSIQNLAQARRGRDVTIYKMHGCVTQSHDAVLTKQDYEVYDQSRRLFTDSLKGDFIEKTLLFLGFSFSDLNVERILAKVREQLGQNQRTHYWVTRRPPQACPQGKRTTAEMEYERRKAVLQSDDLKRYGIQTIWVDEYTDIPKLLLALEAYVTRKGVFVAGAAHDPSPLEVDQLSELSRALGTEIIKSGYNLVSGFGIGIAEQTVLGAFRAIYESTQRQPAERVLIRPFPGNAPAPRRADMFRRHREDLISQVGALIVVSGNKLADNDEVILSAGVQEEVQIALQLGKPIIPIGKTGHVAGMVWKAARMAPERYLPGIDCTTELDVLGSAESGTKELVSAVVSLLSKAENIASARC